MVHNICIGSCGGRLYLFTERPAQTAFCDKNGVSVLAKLRDEKSYLNPEPVYVYTAEDSREYWYTKEFHRSESAFLYKT